MSTRPHTASPCWQRTLLVLGSPLLFLLLIEGLIRVSGVDTDLARNENFRIAVPVWLLADENWVDIERGRLEQPRGVRAADVAWLRDFEEARYIQYKLKPNLATQALNPFNDIEVAKGRRFRLSSNSSGFRTKEFAPKAPGVERIVTVGDSSTFGWGVDPDYTYQHLLEQRLLRDGHQAEVLNLGIPGFTSRHGIGVVDHYALQLRPDVLIISFGANDARYVLQPANELLARDDTWLGASREALLRFESFRLLRRAIFTVYDPFQRSRARARREGDARRLVRAVQRNQYMVNLRRMIGRAHAIGAVSVLLSVCASPAYAHGMQAVAAAENVPFVDALEIFHARIDDLRAHRIYSDEVRFYEDLYGPEAMAANWRLYVTTDGCHPGRAGHSLIADALEKALAGRDGARVSATETDRRSVPPAAAPDVR